MQHIIVENSHCHHEPGRDGPQAGIWDVSAPSRIVG
jgi:hypothetical protein